jgi:hypothetical protein
MSFSSTGLLAGKPQAAGLFSFTIQVSGANGSISAGAFSLEVDKTVVLPHFAAGGSYTTLICAVNTGARVEHVAVAFRGDNGTPISLSITGAGNVTSVAANVAAGGMQCFEAANPQGPTIGGSAVVTSDPDIAIQALFRNAAVDGNYYEASVPPSNGGIEFAIPFDATVFPATGSQIFTGVAIANFDSAKTAHLTCTARDNTGKVIPNAISPPALNPSGHWADYRFPALNGSRGTLNCTSDTTVGMIGLRFLGYGAFSSLPVITLE